MKPLTKAKRNRRLTALAIAGPWSPFAWSGWLPDTMIDPQDGKFDVSQHIAIDRFRGAGQRVAAGGPGFRYRLARLPGLQAGIDIARGPEDTSFYITAGSARSL